MIDVEALIAGAKKAFEQAEPEDVRILIGEELTTVRLWPLTGQEWRELVAEHPARTVTDEEGREVISTSDRAYAANIDSLIRAYPRVALVDGDDVTMATPASWARLVDVLPADALEGIAATVMFINVAEPSKRLMRALGKASRGEGQKKQPSPENSEPQSGS